MNRVRNTCLSTVLMLLCFNTNVSGETSEDRSAPRQNSESSGSKQDLPESLIEKNHIRVGGFGGPSVRLGSVNSTFAVLSGAKGGFVFNDTLVIGASGYGLLSPRFSDSTGDGTLVGYGGILLEYILWPRKIINLSIGTIIGAGGAFDNAFFVWEPELNLFVNITGYFKIGISASYRITSGLNNPVLNDHDLSGFSAGLQFVFGKF